MGDERNKNAPMTSVVNQVEILITEAVSHANLVGPLHLRKMSRSELMMVRRWQGGMYVGWAAWL